MFALAAQLGEERGARLKEVTDRGREGLKAIKVLYDWSQLFVRTEAVPKSDEEEDSSLDEHRHAQYFRDALVPAIAHAKSEQAYSILEEIRLAAPPQIAKYLRLVQFNMREEQYAKKSLAQTEYLQFERTLVQSISEYSAFAMAVENDLLAVKSQVEKGDFSLRRFFNSVNFKRIKTDSDGLALEEDFQSLLGSELNHASAGRYVVALEPILPNGTRRDVLCQVSALNLKATIELKMSAHWTVSNYIEALHEQLQGQYMMAENSKIGFFVIVLQKERTWEMPGGAYINFDELLAILRDRAREKSLDDSTLFLRVIGIDATPPADFRKARGTKGVAKDTPSKYMDGEGNEWSG